MNVLVTGANGFIGSALCERLLAEGRQVRGAVRSQVGRVSLPAGIEAVSIGSIGPDTDWSKALNGVDTVVHLAARVHVMNNNAFDSLTAFRRVNVKGTKRLAQQALAANVSRFFFMSSIKVIGEGTGDKIRDQPPTQPYVVPRRSEVRCQGSVSKQFFSEEDVPEPQDPYAVSKWEAEQVLHEIAATTDLELVVLRPPLVYGPGVKANFLRLLESVARGVPLPLANVNNQRSLIYIRNLVDAVVTCISHPKAAGQTCLVSDGEDVSTPELIRRIGFALERPAHMFPFPTFLIKFAGRLLGKSAEVERLLGSLMVDCSKIKRELGWKPPYTMAQGLEETAEWYLKRRNISRKGAKTLR